MPRRKHCRRVSCQPPRGLFKPAGIPTTELDIVTLSVDELESLRLADLEDLYHEQAAERMHVSRQTFGRIVSEARRKVAAALVGCKALQVQGGEFELDARGGPGRKSEHAPDDDTNHSRTSEHLQEDDRNDRTDRQATGRTER